MNFQMCIDSCSSFLHFLKAIYILTFSCFYTSGRKKPDQSALDYGLQEILRSHGTGERTNEAVINIA